MLEPVSISVETFGTETADPAKIETALRDIFDLRPGIIVQRPAASLRTPGLDLWITRSTNRRFPGSLWIKLGLTVCHLTVSCYTVTFREVIEGVLAAVWGDSPIREARFPKLKGAVSGDTSHMGADLGFHLVEAIGGAGPGAGTRRARSGPAEASTTLGAFAHSVRSARSEDRAQPGLVAQSPTPLLNAGSASSAPSAAP